jgi:clathrin heavy chain
MATNLPFKFQEVFNLTSLNLNPQLFKQGLLSFESQKYISVKDGGQVAIINTSNGFSVERKDMPADSMIMHRERNVIAVRAFKNNQTVVQVYDLDPPGSKLKQFIVNEQISFWRWISDNKLCLVGAKSVYHADLNGNEPEKILDRVEQMSTCQIMNYDTDADGKWVFLLGLYSPD